MIAVECRLSGQHYYKQTASIWEIL